MSRDASFALIAGGDSKTVKVLGTLPPPAQVGTVAGAAGAAGAADGVGEAARFDSPVGVVVLQTAPGNDARTAFIADTENATIRALDLETQTVSTVAGAAGELGDTDGTLSEARFRRPIAIAGRWSGSYTLFVADQASHTIRKISELTFGDEDEVTTIGGLAGATGQADGVGSAARFDSPSGIAYHPSAPYLLVADSGNHTIRKLESFYNPVTQSSSYTVTTLAGSADTPGNVDGALANARFNTPTNITISPNGAFAIVSDEGNGALRLIDLERELVSTVATELSRSSAGTNLAEFGNAPVLQSIIKCDSISVLLSDSEQHTLSELNLLNGQITVIAGAPGEAGAVDGAGASVRFTQPGAPGLSCGADENELVIADSGNDIVRGIELQPERLFVPLVRRE